MQIIRTDVAATGHPILRVAFCGEGGDCVTVDMAGLPGHRTPTSALSSHENHCANCANDYFINPAARSASSMIFFTPDLSAGRRSS